MGKILSRCSGSAGRLPSVPEDTHFYQGDQESSVLDIEQMRQSSTAIPQLKQESGEYCPEGSDHDKARGTTRSTMKRRRRRTSSCRKLPTRKQLAVYHRERAAVRACNQQRFRRPSVILKGGQQASEDMMTFAAEVERRYAVDVQVCAAGDLSQGKRGHVLGDGNCLWRALAKAWRAETGKRRTWHSIKKASLKMESTGMSCRIRQIRTYAYWGDNAAIALAATRLHSQIRVQMGPTCVQVSPCHFDKQLTIAFEKQHFFPVKTNEPGHACPVPLRRQKERETGMRSMSNGMSSGLSMSLAYLGLERF